ncbi:hypothetical protein L1887_57954 [Cichorium endivia]|nr:hypothetical protein L1887_57954 [Cichorium endivia]
MLPRMLAKLTMVSALLLSVITAASTSNSATASTTGTATSTASASATATATTPVTVPDAEQQERFSSLALFLVLSLLILSFWTSYYLKVKRITAGARDHRRPLCRHVCRSLPARRPRRAGAEHAELQQHHHAQRAAAAHHPRFRLRLAPGELFPQLWHHPHLCICRHVYQRHRGWAGDRLPLVAAASRVDLTHAARMPHLWLDPQRHRSGDHPSHLQHVQGGPQAVLGDLWREHPQRCGVDRDVRHALNVQGQGDLHFVHLPRHRALLGGVHALDAAGRVLRTGLLAAAQAFAAELEILVYKPLFIIVTVLAVVASRYCAVFPIASVVNAVKRARNNRRARATGGGGVPRGAVEEELPRQSTRSCSFGRGLRGAVGFALSAGIEGQNAIALQTTVLVTVVLTVIVFGGTTAQMLEILGIRTGVQDDEGDSDDEEDDDDVMRLRGMQRRTYLDSGSYRDASERAGLTRSGRKAAYRDASETSSPARVAQSQQLSVRIGDARCQDGRRTYRASPTIWKRTTSDPHSLPRCCHRAHPHPAQAQGSRRSRRAPASVAPPHPGSREHARPPRSTRRRYRALSEIRKAVLEASSSDGSTSSPA